MGNGRGMRTEFRPVDSSQGRSNGDWRQSRPNGPKQGSSGNNSQRGTTIAAHCVNILEHIRSHRITFLQGDTGCGKSVNVPQFILDDATARGQRDSVRVIVAQPRRVAAVSLAKFVAHSRGEPVGRDVGFAVGQHRAATPRTRLTFVTSGYLLELLAHSRNFTASHIIVDEVHCRSVEQDLLLLLVKHLMIGTGSNHDRYKYPMLRSTKLIIMSATMEVGPLQKYFGHLLKNSKGNTVDPIIVGGPKFSVDVVHIDEMVRYLPRLPKPVSDLATRLVETSGKGERALDRTNLPRFAIDLVTGLIMHIGRIGECILVFVASYADILELQQGFERSVKENKVPGMGLDVQFLHSILSKEDQEMAIAPPNPGTLKIVIATNIAESSLTVPNVRVVIDLGHQVQIEYDVVNSCSTKSRVWCSKASAKQRAGRAGRLSDGIVFRLFTKETYENFPEYEKPAIAVENLGSTILRVKSLFQLHFPSLSVVELLQLLLDPPKREDVDISMQELQTLGAVTMSNKSDSAEFCKLTMLGRLAIQLLPDVDLARLVFLGIVMGCGVDCVVMAAGISLLEDMFHQPLLVNKGSTNFLMLQERRIANMRARMRFYGGYSSDLLVYCQIYLEWVYASLQGRAYEWIKRSELQPARLKMFLLRVGDYAQKTIHFIERELHDYFCTHWELDKLRKLAAAERHVQVPTFSTNIAIVQMAIAGAFSRNWLIGSPGRGLAAVSEIRELEEHNMPAHLSFKLRNVPPNLAGANILKLEKALEVLAPCHKLVPLGENVVLVQCELQEAKMTSPPIIWDLPIMARIANYMAKSFSRNGELILYTKKDPSSNAEVEELSLGRPSGARTIKWATKIGKESRKVQFPRLSLFPRAVEMRKDVPFHIAVAVNLCYTPDTFGVTASLNTVLPQDNLFSVLVLLMFRPSGPDGELHIRLLSDTDRNRIYSVRYQGRVLELAPRFICMDTLKYVDGLRSTFQGFIAGTDIVMKHCNLGQDMMNLHHHILTTQYGAPILAPEIGPWLAYPSLMPVEDKSSKPQDFHHQLKWGLQQPDPQSPGPSKHTTLSPVLLQSKKYMHNYLEDGHEESSPLNASKLSDMQLFERAFAAAEVDVDRTQLLEWIGGNTSYNGMHFELLQKLVKQPGDMGHMKVVLQYVYLKRKDLVNKKQMTELEGLYHSICNPDLLHTMPRVGCGNKAPQTVEIYTHTSKANCGLVTSVSKEDLVTKKITVQHHQKDRIIYDLNNQQLAAKITIGSSSSNQRPVLVTVHGKGVDVGLALQWIKTITHVEYCEPWEFNDTYIAPADMGQKLRCVNFNEWERKTTNAIHTAPLVGRVEFVLVQDNHDRSSGYAPTSLYSDKMKEVFDNALKGRGSNDIVKLQARLGRVTFTCPRGFMKRLPFPDKEAEPLGKLTNYFDRQVHKRRFDDSIPEKTFYHLRACLHLCHPKTVRRRKTYVIVVSNVTAKDERILQEKFKIVDAPDFPGSFQLKRVEKKERLAAVDIMRLHPGAIEADVRLSMQTKEKLSVSEEARDYVRKIQRRGSKLEFPETPYAVQVQRHKEAERFEFDGFLVSLTEVKQIGRGLPQTKYEVEFEARGPYSEVGQRQMAIQMCALTDRIPVILEQVESVCSQMSWIGPSNTATGVVHALLRSWTVERNETKIKNILVDEFYPAQSKNEVVGVNQEQISLQICNLVEMLYYCDGRILKKGMDVAAELQLVLLRLVQSMTISLSESVEGRVKWFVANHKLEPENALQYACLLKCHCTPLHWTWDSVLEPYVMQLMLEQRLDILEKFFSRLSVQLDFLDCSSAQLLDATIRSSIWTTLSALTRLFQTKSTGMFIKLINVLMTYGEAVAVVLPTSLMKQFVGDLLSYHDLEAAAFVGGCLEWTLDNESSIINWSTHTQNLLWLLKMLRMSDLSVDENCRAKVLDLLLRLPSSIKTKRDLEEVFLDIYGVEETRFRNLHYQRILQQLGHLQDAHKEELKKRGLNEKQCNEFNFQSWTPGKIRNSDVRSSSLIPGLNERGTRLLGSRGIFIPSRDPSGQITGGQIKVDVNRTGKYVWLSSNKAFDGGKGPNIGGELPLFCCVPEESDTSVVGFCEGGLKAHVLAALSGLPVIGASGADFHQSKNLLESYLVMMDVEQIIFFPDAGSQCNDQVIRSYFRTFRLLRDWGCNVLVAWWGQVNKTQYDDIDDYLVRNTSATELPLFSTSQFWQLVHPDVQEKLRSEFPEYKKPQVLLTDVTAAGDETFTDDDDIKIVKMLNVSDIAQNQGSRGFYQITIPKGVMRKMPPAPDDYVTPQSVQNFTIEVLVVQIDDFVGVGEAIDWLLPQCQRNVLLGLDCEHGFSGNLHLIQLSTHQRCVLIRLTNETRPHPSTSRLAAILQDKTVVKSGAEVQDDALAIHNAIGLMVNGFKNISSAYKTMNRTKGLLEIFRDLYGWEWIKKKDVTRSDWGCVALTLEQVKYAALDAWASRMIALQGPAALDETLTSLEDLPHELLKLFARAIANSNTLRRKEKTVFETSGNITEGSRSTLRLLQHSFRERVTGIGSRVELRFNDGQKPAVFHAQSRIGKSVTLTPWSKDSKAMNSSSARGASTLPINISSISSIVVDNSKSGNLQSQRLRDAFYRLLCHPEDCPEHLSMALRCEKAANTTKKPEHEKHEKSSNQNKKKEKLEKATEKPERVFNKKQAKPERAALPMGRGEPQLMSRDLKQISASLNDSQHEALQQILTSRLSATIGPPGTGKTRLITAIARAWLHVRGAEEILLCTAYQNVAARNITEALVEEQVNGVLLLVSEDYFVDWHESFYEKLANSVVITKTRCEIPGALDDWRMRNKGSTPSIIVCTIALVGSSVFMTSLMGGKVTAMVIDECSQASEGSCIHPLTCLPDLSLLTVLGDPHQLPPFSGSGSIKVPSIFDLVSNGCEVKLLREQYRMPPIVCDFISSEVYQKELQTAPTRHRTKDWDHPLLWVDIEGVATRDSGNPSLYNMAEAKAIIQFCQKLSKSDGIGIGKGVGKRIVVLTLYEEQNRQISKLLAMDPENLQEKVNVHNVDSFQGQQSDIVLISLVAGKHFSTFAAARHRACVMLSRVKRFLCVFGNHKEVRRNCDALMWNSLAVFCEARGFVVALKDAESVLSANLRMAATSQDFRVVDNLQIKFQNTFKEGLQETEERSPQTVLDST